MFFRREITALLVLGAAIIACASTGPIISANPDASLANGNAYLQQGVPLLFEYHRLTTGDSRQRFAYPQRNYSFRGASKRFISSVDGLHYGLDGNLHIGAFSTYNHTDDDSVLPGGYGGISASGYIDSLDFDFNAALYVERHDIENLPTADRQETDWVLWDHSDSDVINYKRMQGHFGLNYAWLRLEMGRDALHWGPGFYNNLALNRQAVPYGYFSVDLVFGPLRVISFYSKLEIDSIGSKIHSDGRRHLYGHRYELALGNATFGMSEIQVIYNNNNPWLLVPIFPQFIEKGNYTERSNNGTLAFDANYRLFRFARVYGEFYLEDLDSPMAVIENEYLNSQWALMFGTQIAHDFTIARQKVELGSVLEYARVDQRVYTHYEPNEGQIANAGYPLGHPLGPNSQSVDWMVYSRLNEAFFVGLRSNWSWKGSVYGSDINCKWEPGKNKKKDFLGGAKMDYTLVPSLAYYSDFWSVSGSLTLFNDLEYQFGLTVHI
ncbi:hypothetical protein [uncultured Fibrobacter sp.]|uniref:hypothetical protein n=1 Tax=uncultured Fibrobacter sp. TaxID=261512 RepID=UPI0025D3D86C|nr:hypothetical protein [uncultured Fibrobacter sp.]